MVSVQTTGGLGRRIEFAVPAARIRQEKEQRLKTIGRTARLDGFRPGKVPFSVIEKRFGGQIHDEVVNELVQRTFSEAITEHKLQPAGGPRIEPVKPGVIATANTPVDEDFKFTATFEVYPEVKLQGLDALQIERPAVEVKDSDIESMLEHLRKQRPTFAAVTRAAEKGDRVTIDFAGRIGGELFTGGQGTDFPVVLGAGRMLPEFENGLFGMQAGDEKKVTVNFPADYQGKDVAGKAAEFTLTVKTVEAPEYPALDEAFVKSLGVEGGPEELRKQIGENMRREVADNTRAQLKTQVLDKLLAANPVELPRALVDSQISDMQVDYARRSGAKDVGQIPPREQFEETARRRVALGLLINEIIKTENLKADRSQVQLRLEAIAAQSQNPQETLQSYRKSPEAMHHVEALVLEDQVIDWLLGKAKTTDTPKGFKEFMQFEG